MIQFYSKQCDHNVFVKVYLYHKSMPELDTSVNAGASLSREKTIGVKDGKKKNLQCIEKCRSTKFDKIVVNEETVSHWSVFVRQGNSSNIIVAVNFDKFLTLNDSHFVP